jgi:hypothetical protein
MPVSHSDHVSEDLFRRERDWVLSEFKGGRSPILIATDVASRGLGAYLLFVISGSSWEGLMPFAAQTSELLWSSHVLGVQGAVWK